MTNKVYALIISLLALVSVSCSNLPMSGNEDLFTWYPYTQDFNTSLDSRWHVEAANSSRVNLSGGFATVTVNPSDEANHGNRTELAIYNCGQYKDTVFYGFDFLVPTGDPDDFTWQILSQWYQLPDFEHGESFENQFPHPPLILVLNPGKLILQSSIPEEKIIASTAITKNTWYRAIVKVHYDVDTNGSVDMWFGPVGSVAHVSTAPYSVATLHNKAGIYFKMGLYRGIAGQTQAGSTNSVQLDNFKIGRSLSEVQ